MQRDHLYIKKVASSFCSKIIFSIANFLNFKLFLNLRNFNVFLNNLLNIIAANQTKNTNMLNKKKFQS